MKGKYCVMVEVICIVDVVFGGEETSFFIH